CRRLGGCQFTRRLRRHPISTTSETRPKRRSYGAYLDEYPEQDFEDAEASRKIAEEAGLPQKKNHLPE
ncbi:hypothetical protein, partial [Paracoccus benzoatiresistens]